MTSADLQKILAGIAGPLKEQFAAMEKRINVLEHEWVGLEHKQQGLDQRMRYRSIWDPTTEYQTGNFVTFNGGMWHAQVDSKGMKPGESGSWKLAVMRGKAWNQ